MKDPKVLVFMITYHGWKDTKECIESLQKQTYKNFDMFVVDNSENAEDAKELRKAFPRLKIHENREDKGCSGANNQGIEEAFKGKYDFIWILNNDVVIGKECLAELVKGIMKDDTISVVGPKSYILGTNKLQPIGRKYKPHLGRLVKHIGEEEDNGQFDHVQETDYLWGGSLLMRISTLRKVGMYDVDYFLYYEPLDLQLRIKQEGYKVMFIPTGKMEHKVGQSQPSSKTFDYYTARNRFLIVKKFNTHWQKLVFYTYFFCAGLPSNIIKRVVKGKFKSAFWTLEGAFDALRSRYGFKYN